MNLERLAGTEVLAPPEALGYVALMAPQEEYEFTGVSFSPNPAYEQYLRMHKVFVGQRGAMQLEAMHAALQNEEMPRYLSAAGWAAAEAALVRTNRPTEERLELLDAGIDCWRRALESQRNFNADAPYCLVECAAPYRMALDLAIAPLLRHMIAGYVPRDVCKQVFADCLNVAQANAVRLNLMVKEGNIEGVAEHSGFGYECNALLAVNRRLAATRFVIPSMIRSDSGYYHSQQTHDLLIIRQEHGHIQQVTPVEIKASASNRDRARYKALLVRGKMHLSVEGKFKPEDTLQAITAVYEGTATRAEKDIAEGVTSQMLSMFNDYCAGEDDTEVASTRSLTVFHKNTKVVANHPGLLVKAG